MIVFEQAVAPLSQVHTAAVHIGVVALDKIAFDYCITALEAYDCTSVAVVIGRVIIVRRGKAVVCYGGIIDEGVIENKRADVARRV